MVLESPAPMRRMISVASQAMISSMTSLSGVPAGTWPRTTSMPKRSESGAESPNIRELLISRVLCLAHGIETPGLALRTDNTLGREDLFGNLRDVALMRFEAYPQWQAYQAIAGAIRMSHRPMRARATKPGGRTVQRDIMKHGTDAGGFHALDEGSALRQSVEQEVIHVGVVRAFPRDRRAPQHALGFQRFGPCVVAPPDGQTLGGDAVALFQLRSQKRRDQFTGQVGRADIDPGVLVHLAAEVLAAIGALLADHLCPLDQCGVVHQQGAAFAGDHVLGFVEAQRRQVADAAQCAPLVA